MQQFQIEINKIFKIYKTSSKNIAAINNLSLKINPGEILGLLGPNGAGKTTLLKVISTILEPSSGEIFFNNSALNSYTEKNLIELKRNIGYLPETPFMYYNLCGEEYISFIGSIYGMERAEVKNQIDFYFDIFELNDVRKSFMRTYSQGMLKKTSLIAALINNQSILLLDEPTNSLDPKAISTLKSLLIKFKEEGKTIILSTHILDIAEKLSDRIAILDKGILKLVDSISVLNKIKIKGEKTRLEELFIEITK